MSLLDPLLPPSGQCSRSSNNQLFIVEPLGPWTQHMSILWLIPSPQLSPIQYRNKTSWNIFCKKKKKNKSNRKNWSHIQETVISCEKLGMFCQPTTQNKNTIHVCFLHIQCYIPENSSFLPINSFNSLISNYSDKTGTCVIPIYNPKISNLKKHFNYSVPANETSWMARQIMKALCQTKSLESVTVSF